MCDLCEQIDGFGPAPNRLTPELLAAAQAIERALPGTAVPAEAWTITSGVCAGAIEWRHFERITRSLDAADTRLKLSTWRCDPA